MSTATRTPETGFAALAEHLQKTRSAVERYISLGWTVIPIEAGKDFHTDELFGRDHGKKPFGKFAPHGLKDGTNDKKIAKKWFSRLPALNIGIVTGKVSGIFMVGPDGEQGYRDFEELQQNHGKIPETATAMSGGGPYNRHYIFQFPADRKIRISAHHKGTEIDIRGDGGYFVAAPSVHALTGNEYVWLNDLPPAIAPGWLIDWCEKNEDTQRRLSGDTASSPACGSMPLLPSDNTILQRAAAYVATIGPAISGQGGSTVTSRAACALIVGFDLSISDAMPIMQLWNTSHAFPQWSSQELARKLEWAAEQPGQRGTLRDAKKNRPYDPNDDTQFNPDTIDALIEAFFGTPEKIPEPVSVNRFVANIPAPAATTTPVLTENDRLFGPSNVPTDCQPPADDPLFSPILDSLHTIHRCPNSVQVLQRTKEFKVIFHHATRQYLIARDIWTPSPREATRFHTYDQAKKSLANATLADPLTGTAAAVPESAVTIHARQPSAYGGQLLSVACRNANCSYCGPRLRAAFRDIISEHFFSLPTDTIYRYTVTERHFAAVSKANSRAGASYHAANSTADGTGAEPAGTALRTFYSTVPPTSKRIPFTNTATLSASEAFRQLSNFINNIPPDAWQQNVITSSRDWSMARSRPRISAYTTVCVCPRTSTDDMLAILAAHNITPNEYTVKDRYFPSHAITWTCHSAELQASIERSAVIGEYTPSIDFEADFIDPGGYSTGPPGAATASTASAASPASQYQTVW